MRFLLIVFVLLPAFAFAQLDRLRTDMTEQDFIKQFPGAVRNLDEEAFWTGGADTVNGIEGNALWRIYNDTVDVYRFITPKVEGPSAAYPDFDSAAVHNMKVCLDKVRASLEAEFGKPSTLRNNELKYVGKDNVNRAYLAVWKFPNSSDYIQLSVTTDLSAGNYINAPGKFTVTESQSYEMIIEITHRTDFTMMEYDLGKSSERFFTIYRNFRAPLLRDRIYTIQDSTITSNAEWTVKFYSGKLVMFEYTAYYGKGYGAKSDADAYLRLKNKAATLLKEGDSQFGKADSLSNVMPPKYQPHERHLMYRTVHCYSRWKTTNGNVLLLFEESGGGKNPETTFHLQVDFDTERK